MEFWVILNFWSTAKKEPTDFGSWSKVFKAQNTIIRTFDQLPKKNLRILAVDWIFWSTEKSQKIRSTENDTFDQLKKTISIKWNLA